jgi:hypothetical protein
MQENQLVWLTDNHGAQSADVNGYYVSVERLLPAADARFIVRGARHPHRVVASGTRDSSREAMFAGEYAAEHMPGRARGAAGADDRDNGSGASAGFPMTSVAGT